MFSKWVKFPSAQLSFFSVAAIAVPLWLINPAEALACSISGRLYGTNGRSYTVALLNRQGYWVREAYAGPRYSFSSVSAGSYRLRVVRNGRYVSTSPRERSVRCNRGGRIDRMDFNLL